MSGIQMIGVVALCIGVSYSYPANKNQAAIEQSEISLMDNYEDIGRMLASSDIFQAFGSELRNKRSSEDSSPSTQTPPNNGHRVVRQKRDAISDMTARMSQMGQGAMEAMMKVANEMKKMATDMQKKMTEGAKDMAATGMATAAEAGSAGSEMAKTAVSTATDTASAMKDGAQSMAMAGMSMG